jgi:hypothetical protein
MAANTAAVYSNEPEPRAERTLKNACLGMLKNACLEDSAVGGGSHFASCFCSTLRVMFFLDVHFSFSTIGDDDITHAVITGLLSTEAH